MDGGLPQHEGIGIGATDESIGALLAAQTIVSAAAVKRIVVKAAEKFIPFPVHRKAYRCPFRHQVRRDRSRPRACYPGAAVEFVVVFIAAEDIATVSAAQVIISQAPEQDVVVAVAIQVVRVCAAPQVVVASAADMLSSPVPP